MIYIARVARADRSHATEASWFDSNPYLLATPGGTVDLTTGELREAKRADLITRFARSVAPFDALVLPTVPILPPPFSAFETDDEYFRLNRLLLRNPSCFNVLDGCAISLPCHRSGDAPVGLMLASSHGCDRHLLDVAATVEAALAPLRTS